MSDALPRLRLSTQRGSAYDGEPSGIRMSQNILATPGYSPRHGSSWNVDGSGLAIMSDSCTRAKPSMAEPSKPIPSPNAPSSSAGATATDLSAPSTSVNQSRTKRMSRSSSVRSTNSSCLSTGITLDVSREYFTKRGRRRPQSAGRGGARPGGGGADQQQRRVVVERRARVPEQVLAKQVEQAQPAAVAAPSAAGSQEGEALVKRIEHPPAVPC